MKDEKKWDVFIRRAQLFSHIPFVEFVLAAGSMALGTAKDNSDFDVIVGVRSGRIFTVRFLCVLVFGLRGWRRSAASDSAHIANKICLNHFVTSQSYQLEPPYSESWRMLYKNLVPLWGDTRVVAKFSHANTTWTGEAAYNYTRHSNHSSRMQRIGERILGGRIGEGVEWMVRYIQIRRIKKSISGGRARNPRIVCSDNELRFHPDTRSRLR